MKYVYMVQIDWSTTDSGGIETTLFRNYDDAYNFYKNRIIDECNLDISWIGSEVFDENGEVNDGYDVDCDDNNSGESDVYWHVVDEADYYRHTLIDLIKKEVM